MLYHFINLLDFRHNYVHASFCILTAFKRYLNCPCSSSWTWQNYIHHVYCKINNDQYVLGHFMQNNNTLSCTLIIISSYFTCKCSLHHFPCSSAAFSDGVSPEVSHQLDFIIHFTSQFTFFCFKLFSKVSIALSVLQSFLCFSLFPAEWH